MTLVGVPGIGKSRLVGELFRIVDGEPELITWRQGRCLPYGESVTFWALGEIVKARGGDPRDRRAGGGRAKAAATPSPQLVPEDERGALARGGARALVGLAGDGRRVPERRRTAPGGASSRRSPSAGPACSCSKTSTGRTTACSTSSTSSSTGSGSVPLLVVGTARPELLERRPAWGGGKANATTLSLQPLDDDDTARLIAEPPRAARAARRRAAGAARAGGREPALRGAVRPHARRARDGGRAAGVGAGRDRRAARRAAAAEKELLQEAAVHGKVFWLGAVRRERRCGDEAEDVVCARSSGRTSCAASGGRRSPATTQYAFHHVLLRDVAYGQIPRRARAEKHRRAAEWIEGLGRPDDHAELLAHHYKQALELARAAGVEDDSTPASSGRAQRFGPPASARFRSVAYGAAAEFFADALALSSPDDRERPRLLVACASRADPARGLRARPRARGARRVPGLW